MKFLALLILFHSSLTLAKAYQPEDDADYLENMLEHKQYSKGMLNPTMTGIDPVGGRIISPDDEAEFFLNCVEREENCLKAHLTVLFEGHYYDVYKKDGAQIEVKFEYLDSEKLDKSVDKTSGFESGLNKANTLNDITAPLQMTGEMLWVTMDVKTYLKVPLYIVAVPITLALDLTELPFNITKFLLYSRDNRIEKKEGHKNMDFILSPAEKGNVREVDFIHPSIDAFLI